MKPKYSDCFPCNARINIDFVKQKVKFDYPGGKQPTFSDKFKFVFDTWFMICHWLPFLLATMFLTVFFAINLASSIFGFYGFNEELMNVGFVIGYLCLLFILPWIISLIFARYYFKFQNWFPKFNYYFLSFFSKNNAYYKEVKVLDKPVFEIPLFCNMVLDYVVEGDFAKYLKEIDIREHDFVRADFEPNKFLFCAKFIFSRTPKKGRLFVKFK